MDVFNLLVELHREGSSIKGPTLSSFFVISSSYIAFKEEKYGKNEYICTQIQLLILQF